MAKNKYQESDKITLHRTNIGSIIEASNDPITTQGEHQYYM